MDSRINLKYVLLAPIILILGASFFVPAGEVSKVESTSKPAEELGAATMTAQQQRNFYNSFTNLSYDERLSLKVSKFLETVSLPRQTVTYENGSYDIQVTGVEVIGGGIQVFARAWDQNGVQIGFGDGSVDIERFRIINPPILVIDPIGPISKQIPPSISDPQRGTTTIKYSVNPEKAILATIAHTISVMKNTHNASNIVPGKIGNTTSTFYPNAHTETTSVDGEAFISYTAGSGVSWATLIAGSGSGASDSATVVNIFVRSDSGSNNWRQLYRTFFLFDTSSIPDTDVVSSATFSIYPNNKDPDTFGASVSITGSTPSSNTAIASGDYSNVSSTKLATDKSWASISAGAYNNFSLNASGIAAVSVTGVTKLAARHTADVNASSYTWVASSAQNLETFAADQAGTASDPKLVVEHAAAVAGSSPQIGEILWF